MNDREQETFRRMAAHELYIDYGPGREGFAEAQARCKNLVYDYNLTRPGDTEERQRLLTEIFGSHGEGLWIEPPFQAAYGKVTFGSHVYVNVGLTLVDDVEIFIGDRVMIAPRVTLVTTGHPVHPDLRGDGSQFSAPVHIEDDVWIGAGVTILPGVTVGRGSVVASGAVVAGNVPPMSVVGGVPARLIRTITEEDRNWLYRAPSDLG